MYPQYYGLAASGQLMVAIGSELQVTALQKEDTLAHQYYNQ